MSDNFSASLEIWDQEAPPPHPRQGTVLWRSFEAPADSQCICMPRWVEQHSDRMRARYLGWLFEVGEGRIHDRRVTDHLELRPGLSYWWMTPLAQRFNAAAGSPVHDAIKLLALEELLAGRGVRQLTLHSSNAALAECLRAFCKHSEMVFEWVRTGSDVVDRSWRSWTPLALQALISAARHVARRRSGRRLPAQTLAPDAKVTFIDVLVHLDRPAFTTGRFISNYWTALVGMLERAGVRSNWLHQYFQHPAVPSFARAAELVAAFDATGDNRERHVLLDQYLDVPAVVRALRDWARLFTVSRRLRGVSRLFQPHQSALNLWPLFRKEWLEGLRGPTAIVNCLTLSMFERALRNAPRQHTGVYIQENQPWEMALIHTWRAAGHERLIGVPHTTVRYWDLRYFYDPRSYHRDTPNALPMPDCVAVNGPAAHESYLAAGYPSAGIVAVEALRYLQSMERSRITPSAREALRVLICGDFLPSTSHRMLSWMLQAAPSLPPGVSFTFKPHPAYPIDLTPYAALSLQSTQAPLGEVLAMCDVVFASNITSAAVDAYCRGIAVVQMLDGGTFNMSPLRAMPDVLYVARAEDLGPALVAASRAQRSAAAPYFHLDAQLPRWSKLLGIPA